MTKKTFITILVALIITSLFVFSTKGSDSKLVDKISPKTTPTPTISETTATNPSSKYQQFESGILERLSGKRVVLFFYANWCPTCKAAQKDFESNQEQIPDDTMLIRINYNDSDTDSEEKELAEKYNITYQHTFVWIGSNGEQLAKWNGGQLKELLEKIE